MNPHLQRALLLFEQQRHDLAETELRQVLSQDPDDAEAHALLALCLVERKQFQDATAEAEQAVHLAPDLSFAHYALAHVLRDRNRFDEALVAAQESVRLDPTSADSFALVSQLHLDRRHWPAALAAAETGLQHHAEHVACTNLRAIALVKLGRRAEAGATIDAALARNPEDSVTHANQGWTCLEVGDARKALEHFRESLRLDPNNEWARQGIVEALKARNFIYALLLRYFLWMAKLSPGAQWAVVIGTYLGNRALGELARGNAELAPWLLPPRILLFVAIILTWTADPLFNLLLRLNRFGRLVLSREQVTASNWMALCLGLALVSLGLCFVYGFNSIFLLMALVFGLLVLPVSATFRAHVGWPRNVLAAATLILAAIGLGALWWMIDGNIVRGPEGRALTKRGEGALTAFLLGVFVFSWVSNFIITQRPRR